MGHPHRKSDVELQPLSPCPTTNKTPLAETFLVAPRPHSSPADSTTGSAKGNRTAQRTSCRPFAALGTPGEMARIWVEIIHGLA